MALGIHALVEQAWCYKNNITSEMVDEWDMNFKGNGEPGDDRNCPYHEGHKLATNLEMEYLRGLGIDIMEYMDAISNPPEGVE